MSKRSTNANHFNRRDDFVNKSAIAECKSANKMEWRDKERNPNAWEKCASATGEITMQ